MSAVWRGRRVLVTGGLGFIGSALVRRLVEEGARVRVLDSLLPLLGGSPRNIRPVAADVEVLIEDTRNRDAVNRAVEAMEVVFHLAAPAGPGAGGGDIYTDLDVACLGTWHLLEGVRLFAPTARLVFASSLHVYASECSSPVSEEAATGPDTLFGAHKLAGETYLGVYRRIYGLDTVIARLATVFGPRQRLESAGHGPLARALDAVLHGEDVRLFGDGQQRTDLLYVADAAEALLALGHLPPARALTVNVGSGRAVTARQVVEAVIAAAGRGRILDVELGDDAEASGERGLVPDVARLRGIGVRAPATPFEDALRETAAWYTGGAA